MTENELKDRLKAFALRAMKLCEALPRSASGRTLANQLIRSATSVGANYRAACRARSRAEFLAKLGIVEEEADESAYWLELIIESGILKKAQVVPLLVEADEITAIISASRKTVRRRGASPAASSNRNSKIETRK